MVPKAQKPNLQEISDRLGRMEREMRICVSALIESERSSTSHGRTMWVLGLATGYLIGVVLIRVDQKNRERRKR